MSYTNIGCARKGWNDWFCGVTRYRICGTLLIFVSSFFGGEEIQGRQTNSKAVVSRIQTESCISDQGQRACFKMTATELLRLLPTWSQEHEKIQHNTLTRNKLVIYAFYFVRPVAISYFEKYWLPHPQFNHRYRHYKNKKIHFCTFFCIYNFIICILPLRSLLFQIYV